MSEITRLLERMKEGDKEAESRLLTTLYGELKRLAAACLRGNRSNHTLQPTALVNEAYMKMMGTQKVSWHDRAHFFAVAARVMRQILIDYARGRLAQKRGGGAEVVRLVEGFVMEPARGTEVTVVNEALDRLQQKDPRVHQVVELRFFGGLSVEETAEVMGISPRTVKREWSLGRAWLRGELGPRVPAKASEQKPANPG